MTNEVPPQDINDANKNKEQQNVCHLSFKLKEIFVSIPTIYNEQFGLETYTRTIPGVIYSLKTLKLEWRKSNNYVLKEKLPGL